MDGAENQAKNVSINTQDGKSSSGRLSFIPVTGRAQIEAVAELASEIWHEHFVTILSPEQIDYMVDKFQSVPAITNQINSRGYRYFMLMLDADMIGYCGVKEEEEEKRLFLSKLYIHKSHRGHGYASRAFEFMADLCEEKDYHKIWLTVNRFNENTIKVYEKKGFIKTRTQVADIGGGFVMDDFIMEKSLLSGLTA